MRKKRPYCVSTCVCFCNTAHSLNKGPRMCAIRAPAFAPNSPINCATVCLRFGGFLSIIGRGFIGFKAGSRGDRGSRVRISWEWDTILSQGFESRKRFSLGLTADQIKVVKSPRELCLFGGLQNIATNSNAKGTSW